MSSLTRSQFLRGDWQGRPVPPSADAVAEIRSECLALHGVVCRTCGETCAPDAIRFRPQVGGVPLPQIEAATCTGCGDCLPGCPVDAIVLRRREPEAGTS